MIIKQPTQTGVMEVSGDLLINMDVMSKASNIPANIPTPPSLGTGLECNDLSFGRREPLLARDTG